MLDTIFILLKATLSSKRGPLTEFWPFIAVDSALQLLRVIVTSNKYPDLWQKDNRKQLLLIAVPQLEATLAALPHEDISEDGNSRRVTAYTEFLRSPPLPALVFS